MKPRPIADLVQAHPHNPEESYWPYNESLEVMAKSLNGFHEAENHLDFLDGLYDNKDYHLRTQAAHTLAYLPGDEVLEAFGVETLMWAAANGLFKNETDKLFDALRDYAGVDTDMFEKARLWAWQIQHTSRGHEVIAQYALMEALNNGALAQLDTATILQNSARPGVALSPKRQAQYALVPVQAPAAFASVGGYATGWGELKPTLRYDIWLDAPSGILLTYQGLPNAVAGLAVYGDSLMIYQLQGVQGRITDPSKPKYSPEHTVGKKSSRGLAPLDWQSAMVEATEQVARQLGLSQISVQAGAKNYWTKHILPRETKPHLTVAQAKKMYDAHAKRLNFTRGKDGHWHRSVTIKDTSARSSAD